MAASYTNSKTWVSTNVQETEKYHYIINAIKRHFPKSPLVDWDIQSWVAHRIEMADAKVALQQRRIETKAAEAQNATEPGYPVLHKAMGGKRLRPGHTGVLAMHSVWYRSFNPVKDDRIVAPWPGMAEMKWEGDDRARTKVGRFLPLPREPSPENLPWNQRLYHRGTMFDQIWKVPTEEDILYPIWQLSEEVEADKHQLLDEDLLKAIDQEAIY